MVEKLETRFKSARARYKFGERVVFIKENQLVHVTEFFPFVNQQTLKFICIWKRFGTWLMFVYVWKRVSR